MNKWQIVLFAAWIAGSHGREPIRPADGSVPFVVYFPSRYRGLCVGTLVARTVVITAAVCVTNPEANITDTRPINVVTGTAYRHPRRGIRVQVLKILIPNLTSIPGDRGYLMEKSPAVLMLARKVPDVLVEHPLRAIPLDWKGDETLTIHEECFLPGWHFFYKGDKIYPVHKFLLQRNMRVQFVNIVKKSLWCEALTIKFEKALSNLGFQGYINLAADICVKDGMYGAPLICRGLAVGMLMAPDAQWTNCTGFSNVVHLFHSEWLRSFMACVSTLFEVNEGELIDWSKMKKKMYQNSVEDYDYLPAIYDKLFPKEGSSSDDW